MNMNIPHFKIPTINLPDKIKNPIKIGGSVIIIVGSLIAIGWIGSMLGPVGIAVAIVLDLGIVVGCGVFLHEEDQRRFKEKYGR